MEDTNYVTNQTAQWSRFIIEKIIVTPIVEKIPAKSSRMVPILTQIK